MIQSFRDLTVWRDSIDLAVVVYKATENFPRSEMFGLTTQVRRAVVSIPANIAEGKAAGGQNYPRHIRIALGSEAELQTQIELAQRLGMLQAAEAAELLKKTSDVGRKLSVLLQSLR